MPSLLTLVFLTYTDPVRLIRLLNTANGRRTVALLWIAAGLLFLITLMAISLRVSGHNGWLVLWATVGWSAMMPIVSMAITMTWQARFWLLYSVAPLSLLVYALGSFTIFHPLGTVAFYTLLPYYLGATIAVAGAVWVYKNEAWRQRYPKTGITFESLPTLREWRMVAIMRLGFCGILVIGIMVLFAISTERAQAGWVLMGVLCFCLGLLRLESTVAALAGYPLVVEDATTQKWRTTMVGRFALWVTPLTFQSLLPPRLSPVASATAWIALLEDGGVGRHATRQIARLTPEILGEFLLALSMQKGGGDALGLIRPALPPPFQPVAATLQRLAQMGAIPFAMQQWLTTLDDAIPPLRQTYPALTTDLETVQRLLLATRWRDSVLEQSTHTLQRLEALSPTEGWLSALVAHGIQQQTALRHPWE